jgi:hypothetical protein
MLDTDDNHRTNKTNRSSLFTIDRTESNLSFIRRKCDEWLIHGLPKLAQLQCSIDECDLIIEKEWQPFLTEQTRSVINNIIKNILLKFCLFFLSLCQKQLNFNKKQSMKCFQLKYLIYVRF